MGSLLTNAFLAVSLIAWMGRTLSSCSSKLEVGAILLRAERFFPNFSEFLFSCNRLAAGFESGRAAMDEVSR
jgi:hypothetical protein